MAHLQKGQNFFPSLGIVDSQSVRWENNRSLNGVDGNKKIKGIKRQIVLDKNGFLIAVMVTVANIHDSQVALLFMKVLNNFLSSVKIILADVGYRGDLVAEVKKKFGYLLKITVQKDKPNKSFEPIPKRWVIERTFAWFDNDRRMCRNYELLMETAEEIVKISATQFLLNKI